MSNEELEETTEPQPPRTGRRWFLRTVLSVGALGGFYCMLRLTFGLWTHKSLPENAPRIAFSLDDSWLMQLGITSSTYEQAMARAGGRLVPFEPDALGTRTADVEALAELLDKERIDGVLLSGGGDVDPNLYGGDIDTGLMVNRVRDDFEIALVHAAKEANLPILGICRGAQLLNVAFGGTLRNIRTIEELKSAHFSLVGHEVSIAEGTLLAEILGNTHLPHVHSFHGQAVDQLGESVRPLAHAPDGLVEGIAVDTKDTASWIIGVQWHPEMALTDVTQNRLFDTFVDKARQRNAQDYRKESMISWKASFEGRT